MGNGFTLLLVDGIHGIHCIQRLISIYGDRLSTTENLEEMIDNGELLAKTNDGDHLRVEWRDGDIIGVQQCAQWCDECQDYEELVPDNTTVYQVLSCFVSVLINGDTTGLSEDEERLLEAFEQLETNGLDDYHWSYNSNHSNEFGLCEITGLCGATIELHLINMD